MPSPPATGADRPDDPRNRVDDVPDHATETEALLLEQNLIKQLKPRYNVLLRDDKSFPNILSPRRPPFPQIRKHRGRSARRAAITAPSPAPGAVNRTLASCKRCSCCATARTACSRPHAALPALPDQALRAPCVGYISEADYAALVRDAERFLRARSTDVQETLAQRWRRRGDGVRARRLAARPDPRADAGADGPGHQPAQRDRGRCHRAAWMEGGQACVQVFFIRANQNWGNRDFFPRTGVGRREEAEVLEAFLGQFYDNKEPPRQILLSTRSRIPT
jgi:excinuclease ABC subunit C